MRNSHFFKLRTDGGKAETLVKSHHIAAGMENDFGDAFFPGVPDRTFHELATETLPLEKRINRDLPDFPGLRAQRNNDESADDSVFLHSDQVELIAFHFEFRFRSPQAEGLPENSLTQSDPPGVERIVFFDPGESVLRGIH